MSGQMITPELKRWDCTDHDPIEEWIPETDAVLYWLACHIGLPGNDAADMFTVPVATHNGLKLPLWKQRNRSSGQPDPEPIVVDPYSWDAVFAEVQRRIGQVQGHGWESISEQLRHLFDWEYEGQR